MVIKALIPLWKRPEVTRICFEGIKRLQKTIEIDPICIYSEDESKELCKEYGFESYYFENNPLGRKMNFGLDRAFESKWDYLITIGSDDILSEELFEMYKPKMEAKRLAFGIGCIYFYDVSTKKQARQNGMQVYGCGRMLSRVILDKDNLKAKFKFNRTVSGASFQAGKGKEVIVPLFIAQRLYKQDIGDILETFKDESPLWDDDKNTGLDFSSEFRLNARGVTVEHVEIDKKPLALDIKNGTNLHDITEYEPIDFDVLTNFPEGEQIRGLL